MKRKKTHAKRRTTTRLSRPPTEAHLVMVRSWILVVMFAIMLGVGAVVGTFLNNNLNATTPQVAGAQIELQ